MKELVEKYFNGLTTNKEEQEIYNYFLAGNTDPELKEYERYFRGMAALRAHAREIAMDEEVKRVMAMDSDEIRKNIPPDVLEMIKNIGKETASQARNGGRKLTLVKRIGIALAVAASIALLILLFPFWNTSNDFVVMSGKRHIDDKRLDLALHSSLNDLKFSGFGHACKLFNSAVSCFIFCSVVHPNKIKKLAHTKRVYAKIPNIRMTLL